MASFCPRDITYRRDIVIALSYKIVNEFLANCHEQLSQVNSNLARTVYETQKTVTANHCINASTRPGIIPFGVNLFGLTAPTVEVLSFHGTVDLSRHIEGP